MKTEEIVSASSFVVALASLFVSWLAYDRDKGRLDVSISLGEIWDGKPSQSGRKVLFLKIVNSGRRAIMLSSFGGDKAWFFVKQLLSKIPIFKIESLSFIFLNSPIINAHFFSSGQPRVLQEGEYITIVFPWEDHKELAQTLASSSRVYILDSIGKKHSARYSVIKKFRTDFLQWSSSKV